MTAAARDFPPDFLWGAATSAHQVEGRNIHNDWWAWEQLGRVPEASGLACDHYHRYAADFDLASSLGHVCHRLSIEWSRIEPAPGRWNDDALEHYRCVMAALRARGLEPVVTLHHFTTPQWLAARGGWASPGIVDAFARYVRRVVEVLEDHVRWWVTINEPAVLLYQGYVMGVWPPGVRSVRMLWQAMQHVLRAHVAAYDAIHAGDAQRIDGPARVSLANYHVSLAPCRPTAPGDWLATVMRRRLANDVWLQALHDGYAVMPPLVPGGWGRLESWLDYIGVNYYTREFVRGDWWHGHVLGDVCSERHHAAQGERTTMGWEVFPTGLEETLRRLRGYGLPILITENGIATDDDHQRLRFLQRHLAVVARARTEGIPVIGYCYWSLLDNFEWDRGYTQRFGLIEVDYTTQVRRVRDSARWFAQVCRTGQLMSS